MLLESPRRGRSRIPKGIRRRWLASIAVAAIVVTGSSGFAQEPPAPAPAVPSPTEAVAPVVTSEKLESPGSTEAGHGFVEIRFGYYNNDDGGDDGNPFLDEELTVIEPIIVYDTNVTDKLSLWGIFSYDDVSSASIDRLSNFPEQSGASGDNYFGLDLGFRYRVDPDFRYGGSLHLSTEYDYTSIGVGGYVAHDYFDDNTTLKFALNGFFDQIDIIRFDGSEDDGTDNRTSFAATGTWYQILSPVMHGEFGATIGHQTGFLETAYNSVFIEDPTGMAPPTEVTEELPDTRTRFALYGKLRRHVGYGTALGIGGRLYTDTWGVTGISLEPEVHKWLVKDRLAARLRYRYYTQTAADDYSERFTTLPEERTQDSDLGDFDSHQFGIRLDYYVSPRVRLDVSADQVFRSDGLDQTLGSLGMTWTF